MGVSKKPTRTSTSLAGSLVTVPSRLVVAVVAVSLTICPLAHPVLTAMGIWAPPVIRAWRRM
jgi:hypothetical protein